MDKRAKRGEVMGPLNVFEICEDCEEPIASDFCDWCQVELCEACYEHNHEECEDQETNNE